MHLKFQRREGVPYELCAGQASSALEEYVLGQHRREAPVVLPLSGEGIRSSRTDRGRRHAGNLRPEPQVLHHSVNTEIHIDDMCPAVGNKTILNGATRAHSGPNEL
jgi:hypothetical protein